MITKRSNFPPKYCDLGRFCNKLAPFIRLQWHHNECDDVSNHQRLDCSVNRLFRRRSKKISKLRVTGLCEGIHRSPVDSPHKGPVTRKMFPFDGVIMPWLFSILHVWEKKNARTSGMNVLAPDIPGCITWAIYQCSDTHKILSQQKVGMRRTCTSA